VSKFVLIHELVSKPGGFETALYIYPFFGVLRENEDESPD
jgi:hypothetical protein